MTSPSSYLFYNDEESQSTPKIGTTSIRISVMDEEIHVEQLNVIHISESGDITEKCLDKEVYSLEENSNGVRYVKYQRKEKGELVDHSLKSVRSASILPYSSIANKNEDCVTLIERVLLGWFRLPDETGMLAYMRHYMYFPSLEDQNFLKLLKSDNEALIRTLSGMQANGFRVLESLRETDSWESFAKYLCSDTVKTVTDVHILTAHLYHLLPVAVNNLGRQLSSFSEEEIRTLCKWSRFFNFPDSRILTFMLEHNGSKERHEIVDALLQIMQRQDTRTKEGIGSIKSQAYTRITPISISFDRIPENRRAELLRELRGSFLETHQEFVDNTFENPPYDFTIRTRLTYILRHWYAENILTPQLAQSKVTLGTLEDRFLELFNTSFTKNTSNIKSFIAGDKLVCAVSEDGLTMADFIGHDALMMLNAVIPAAERPKDRGLYAGRSGANGFIEDNGSFVPVSGILYFLDDLLTFIEKGTAAIDKKLENLGRDITPANRYKFYMMGYEHQFEESWNIYEWGVTSQRKTRILREKGISTQEEVQMFNSLPDEMFYEFLEVTGNSVTPF